VALHSPGEGQEGGLIETLCWVVAAFTGRTASLPGDQVPAVWVTSSPSWLPALSVYEPMAVQLPAEGHETSFRKAKGAPAALPDSCNFCPGAQLPSVSVNSKPSLWTELS
jgi:hypothetical protein